LASNVIFKEFSADISDLFSALDIYALSSKSEGFCRSLLEAMSSGLPIIATRISEIEEAVIDNKNGLLVDFMDIKTMAFSILALSKNVTKRIEIGLCNRSAVERKFSLVSHTKKIENLYLSII
jgi:glycosyltransferase involved in cell wall biosynthesis